MKSGAPLPETARGVWRRLSAATAKGVAMMLVRVYPGLFGAAAPGMGLEPVPEANFSAGLSATGPADSGDELMPPH